MTSRLGTSRLNHLSVLAKTLQSNTVLPVTSLNRVLNIIGNQSLRKVLSIGPKDREPRSLIWNYNFKVIMDAVEDYARKLIKRRH